HPTGIPQPLDKKPMTEGDATALLASLTPEQQEAIRVLLNLAPTAPLPVQTPQSPQVYNGHHMQQDASPPLAYVRPPLHEQDIPPFPAYDGSAFQEQPEDAALLFPAYDDQHFQGNAGYPFDIYNLPPFPVQPAPPLQPQDFDFTTIQ
ncbi:hypothetical protein JAAARDRAFT_51936, partial [Jaapia argillacea MUCL 33604]